MRDLGTPLAPTYGDPKKKKRKSKAPRVLGSMQMMIHLMLLGQDLIRVAILL